MSSTPEKAYGGEKRRKGSSEGSDISRTEVEHRLSQDNTIDGGRTSAVDARLPSEERKRREASSKLANPLAGLSQEQLARRGEEWCAQHGFTEQDDIRAFRLGAMIAGNMNRFDTIGELTDHERDVLDREVTHKWSNPSTLYGVIIICSLCAAVQGMDETVVNGELLQDWP